MPLKMDNLGLLSSLPFQNVLLPCSPLMYSALMMASLYGCRCFMCKKNGLKRSMTNCESQSNDFALTKCRRLDHDSAPPICPLSETNGSRKCAGTQTLFSSFVPVHNFYPQPPPDACLHDATNEDEPRFILDLDRHMARSTQLLPGAATASGVMRQPTPPPLESESSNVPLNLTLSPSSKSSLRSQIIGRDRHCGQWSASRDQPFMHPTELAGNRMPAWNSEDRDCTRLRMKVQELDNRVPSRPKIWTLTHDGRPSAKNKQQQGGSPRKVTSVVTVECEKDIEEHFQRSLGKDYPKCLAKSRSSNSSVSGNSETGSPTTMEPLSSEAPARQSSAVQTSCTDDDTPDASKANSTISGAVDDHFAKSLGQTWTKIKSQNCQTDFKLPQPGSVDDHFAKALGETWFKLRVKKEGT